MPRTPEVCSSDFCPQCDATNDETTIAASHRPPGRFIQFVIGIVAFLLAVAFQASLTPVYAQGGTATLSGTVTDQNDAVVPGVNVAVISITQGFTRAAITNREGIYVVPLLPPGTYTVKAEREGFATAEVPDVILNVNDQKTLNIPLTVGRVSQSVQIVDGANLIDESPAVATTVDRQFVENLPLNGRSFQRLIALTPGVVVTKSTVAEQGQFSVNGQRADANYFTVDGVSGNIGISAGSLNQSGGAALPGLSAAGGTNSLVSVDALQEFKIQTSTFAPEFGRTPGAQVQIVTRAGTNQFRGKLFEYFRNDALDANDWFNNSIGRAKTALRQNDFGFVLGGPILLPRFGEGGRQPGYDGRNRTLFFFSYEGLRLRVPQPAVASVVPSIATRQAAVPQMRPFLNAYPIPNGQVFANGFAQFNASFSDPSRMDATSIRVDHTINEGLTVFGRYNYSPSGTTQRGIGNTSLNVLNTSRFRIQTLTFGVTQIITPSINNETRANFSRSEGGSFIELDDFGGAVRPPDSILFAPNVSPGNGSFRLDIQTASARTLFVGKSADNEQRQFNVVDNLAVLTGNHQLKFGIDYRLLSPIFSGSSLSQILQFTTAARLISGLSNASVGTAAPIALVLHNLSIYGQDTWRVGPRLTLTYGLRWEVNTAPRGKNGKDIFTFENLDNPAALVLAPRGTPLFETTFDNFAPRFGLTYLLSRKSGLETVLRGGFGIFYDLGAGSVGSATSFFPNVRRMPFPNASVPLSPAQLLPPPLNLNPPFGTVIVADRSLTLPRAYQWNVALEQGLGSTQTISASYVAAIGRRLLRRENIVTPIGDSINITRNAATSDYHALQLHFQRRLSQRLQLLASYTWSHSIDVASTDSGTNAAVQFANPNNDRGSSDFDVRHAFNAAMTYNLPAPRLGAVGNSIFRNWSIDTIFVARSAPPVDLVGGFNLTGFFGNLRPNLLSGIPLYLDDPTAPGGRIFNNVTDPSRPGCKGPFCPAPQSRHGSLGRNVMRGFSLWQLDLALRRQFNFSDHVNLQFRTEIFNVFNHPNFGDPLNNITNANFGRSTSMLAGSLGSGGVSGGFNPLYQVGGQRSIQFAVKLQF